LCRELPDASSGRYREKDEQCDARVVLSLNRPKTHGHLDTAPFDPDRLTRQLVGERALTHRQTPSLARPMLLEKALLFVCKAFKRRNHIK
jgi:hypothetical protein